MNLIESLPLLLDVRPAAAAKLGDPMSNKSKMANATNQIPIVRFFLLSHILPSLMN